MASVQIEVSGLRFKLRVQGRGLRVWGIRGSGVQVHALWCFQSFGLGIFMVWVFGLGAEDFTTKARNCSQKPRSLYPQSLTRSLNPYLGSRAFRV